MEERIKEMEIEIKRLKASAEANAKNRDSARKETKVVQEKYNKLLGENEKLKLELESYQKLIDSYMSIVEGYQKVIKKSEDNVEKMLRLNNDLTIVNTMLQERIIELESNGNCKDCKCNAPEEELTIMDFMMDVMFS